MVSHRKMSRILLYPCTLVDRPGQLQRPWSDLDSNALQGQGDFRAGQPRPCARPAAR